MKKSERIILICVIVLLMCCSAGVAFLLGSGEKLPWEQDSQMTENTGDDIDKAGIEADTETYSTIGNPIITYKGQDYQYNRMLENYLILGIDKREAFEEKYEPGYAGQADFLLLVSVDIRTGLATLCQIHRNTMTPVDYFDESGNKIHSVTEQITLQYGHGIGGSQSCRATEKTVSELLYNIPISGYLTLNLAGVQTMVDDFGGIDVTITKDATDIDPAFTSGRLHMDGELARKFVQIRDIEVFDSATARMDRQTDFIIGLLHALSDTSSGALYQLLKEYEGAYVLTDMSDKDLSRIMKADLANATIIRTPGETVMGSTYEEYYLDEDLWQDLIYQYYYNKVTEEGN